MLLQGTSFALLILTFATGMFDIIPTATAGDLSRHNTIIRNALYKRFLDGKSDLKKSEHRLWELQMDVRSRKVDNHLTPRNAPAASSISVEGRSFLFGGLWSLLSLTADAVRKPLVDYFSGTGQKHQRNQTCFKNVGCFYYDDNMSLPIGPPESPENIQTTFYFFTNNSRQDVLDLLSENGTKRIPEKTWTLDNWTYDRMNETLNTSWPLIVVTHGFLGSKRTEWMMPLVTALLNNMTCTVLVVDWQQGANGSYRDVAMNSPMVGVLISMLLQKIVNKTRCGIGPGNITLIGFSLGGQVMGFAGRHFYNATGTLLHRISGLDPAGYLFDNHTAHLSKNDAEYVDVIHTHAGPMEDFKLGLNKQIGHVDFFPNGGSWQPGCTVYPTTQNFTDTYVTEWTLIGAFFNRGK